MAKNWFIRQDGKEFGPFTVALLKQVATERNLKPTDFVRPEDSDKWTEAAKVKGLFSGVEVEAASKIVTTVGVPTLHTASHRVSPKTIGIGAFCLLALFGIGYALFALGQKSAAAVQTQAEQTQKIQVVAKDFEKDKQLRKEEGNNSKDNNDGFSNDAAGRATRRVVEKHKKLDKQIPFDYRSAVKCSTLELTIQSIVISKDNMVDRAHNKAINVDNDYLQIYLVLKNTSDTIVRRTSFIGVVGSTILPAIHVKDNYGNGIGLNTDYSTMLSSFSLRPGEVKNIALIFDKPLPATKEIVIEFSEAIFGASYDENGDVFTSEQGVVGNAFETFKRTTVKLADLPFTNSVFDEAKKKELKTRIDTLKRRAEDFVKVDTSFREKLDKQLTATLNTYAENKKTYGADKAKELYISIKFKYDETVKTWLAKVDHDVTEMLEEMKAIAKELIPFIPSEQKKFGEDIAMAIAPLKLLDKANFRQLPETYDGVQQINNDGRGATKEMPYLLATVEKVEELKGRKDIKYLCFKSCKLDFPKENINSSKMFQDFAKLLIDPSVMFPDDRYVVNMAGGMKYVTVTSSTGKKYAPVYSVFSQHYGEHFFVTDVRFTDKLNSARKSWSGSNVNVYCTVRKVDTPQVQEKYVYSFQIYRVELDGMMLMKDDIWENPFFKFDAK